MGNYFTNSMENSLKNNQNFIKSMNDIKIERQLELMKQLRYKEVALEIAKERELFFWYTAIYWMSTVGLAISCKSYKKSVLVPWIPITIAYAYQADLAYGNKHARILASAENILEKELDLLKMPHGFPDLSSINTSTRKY